MAVFASVVYYALTAWVAVLIAAFVLAPAVRIRSVLQAGVSNNDSDALLVLSGSTFVALVILVPVLKLLMLRLWDQPKRVLRLVFGVFVLNAAFHFINVNGSREGVEWVNVFVLVGATVLISNIFILALTLYFFGVESIVFDVSVTCVDVISLAIVLFFQSQNLLHLPSMLALLFFLAVILDLRNRSQPSGVEKASYAPADGAFSKQRRAVELFSGSFHAAPPK